MAEVKKYTLQAPVGTFLSFPPQNRDHKSDKSTVSNQRLQRMNAPSTSVDGPSYSSGSGLLRGAYTRDATTLHEQLTLPLAIAIEHFGVTVEGEHYMDHKSPVPASNHDLLRAAEERVHHMAHVVKDVQGVRENLIRHFFLENLQAARSLYIFNASIIITQ